MTAGYAAKPGLLRSAFKHLFSARKSDWDKFDGHFRRVLARQARAVAVDDLGLGRRRPTIRR